MRKGLFLALSPFVLVLWSAAAAAQFDTSSAILLKSGGKGPSAKDLDSSRYKIRNPESRKDDDIEEKPGTYIPSPVPRSRESSKVSVSTQVQVQTPAPSPVPGPVPIASPTGEDSRPENEEHPPVTVQVRELFFGGENDIDEYNARIHPEDPRANMMSISIAPAYFYDGSSSNYSFRNYNSGGPGFGLGMKVWMTPFFGLQSKYFSSVSSGVREGTAGSVVPMDTQEFEAGLRFRKHFGYTRKSAQLSWGVDYHDSSNKISKDATETMGRKTSGLSLALEGTIPTSTTYAHIFEVAIRPFQHHSEVQTTVTAKSGTKNQTNAVHLGIGGQWTLDRHNQVFWKGQYSVERNLFNGAASEADAQGRTPDGVSVTNSLLIFYFGFKWGS